MKKFMEGGYCGLTVSSKTMLKFKCNCDGRKRWEPLRGNAVMGYHLHEWIKTVILGRISPKGGVWSLPSLSGIHALMPCGAFHHVVMQ